MPVTKRCRGPCEEIKSVNHFNKNKRMDDGLEPLCKPCRTAKRKKAKKWSEAKRLTVTSKKCIKCKQTFSVSNFTKDPATSDGYRSSCNTCRSEYREEKALEYEQIHQTSTINPDEPKVCSCCKKTKTINDFGYKKHKRSGLNSICLSCATQQEMRRHKLKTLIIQRFLQTRKCADCGCDDWKLLENDHTCDDKATRSTGLSYRTISKLPTFQKVVDELKKCDVVCIMCHRIRTHGRFDDSSDHNMKQKKLERRKEVDKWKLQKGSCAECKLQIEDDFAFLFDLDHIDPSTKVNSISDMCNSLQSIESIRAEVEKCRLLCCKCHRLHTRDMGSWNDITEASEDDLKLVDQLLSTQVCVSLAEHSCTPSSESESEICTD